MASEGSSETMRDEGALNGPGEGQLEFTREELLASHRFEEPLIAADVRCHGGFIDGSYTIK